MKFLMAGVLLLLAGCVAENPYDYSSGHNTTTDYDISDGSGLRINFTTDMTYDISIFQFAWSHVVKCTGLTAKRLPYIAIVDQTKIPGAAGMFYSVDQVIEVVDLFVGDQNTIKHEMIHYLIYMNNLDPVKNQNHDYDYFNDCSLPRFVFGVE